MYKHILIATDGSQLAQKGVDHGLALAGALNARVTFVAVSELLTASLLTDDPDVGIFTATADLRAASDAAAKRIVEAAGARAKAAKVAFEIEPRSAAVAAEGILETAEERACDLIVLASHGRRGVERLLLGSQAAEVVTRARVPVLVVK